MSTPAVDGRPGQPSASPIANSWSVMEARLVAAKVQDLLGDASARLSRLADQEKLPSDIAAGLEECLRTVVTGRETITSVRRSLQG